MRLAPSSATLSIDTGGAENLIESETKPNLAPLLIVGAGAITVAGLILSRRLRK